MAMTRLARVPKPEQTTEWGGRGTIAYVSEASKKEFLNLPPEIHARLQLASAQLDTQNSIVRRVIVGRFTPPKISTVEKYELARYNVDWPSPTAEHDVLDPPRKTSRTMVARIQYNKTKTDYMEYLWSHIPQWEMSDGQLKEREVTRVELVKIAARAIRERMADLGLPTSDFTVALHCFGSFCSGFAIPSSEMDLTVVTRGVPSILDSELPRLFKAAYIAAGFNVYTEPEGPIAFTVQEKCEDETSECIPLYNIHFENVALKMRTTTLLRCYRACDDRVYEMVFSLSIGPMLARSMIQAGTLRRSTTSHALTIDEVHATRIPPAAFNIGMRNLEWIEGHETFFWDNFEEIARVAGKGVLTSNRQSAGELLRGFFTYYSPVESGNRRWSTRYSKFNWKNDVVSIRNPNLISKEAKRWDYSFFNKDGTRTWNFLAIEDPFNPNNNLAKSISKDSVFIIRREFERVNMIMNCAEFVPGFGWEWANNNDEVGEDIFDDRIPATLKPAD
ncbi:CID1 [Coccidioides immitis H538.4]|uniref:CID1 n=1 Tax=Coccidioides immitis H538.4 TaxID=396776 RepID=A0A0J8S046_COCIT|nr:CID1 [Coccidioides immitis H538.4]